MVADRPEGNDTVLHKGPCPVCGSKDNCVTYADLHETCFTPGCKHYVKAPSDTPPWESEAAAPKPKAKPHGLLSDTASKDAYDPLTKRGLTTATLRRFGYFRTVFNGKGVQVAPYFSQAGEPVVQKVRFPDKDFTVLKAEDAPSIGDCQLFGRHVFGDRLSKRVVITEGELDALTVAQVLETTAMRGNTAVCSLNAGADSAEKCLKVNYLWLDNFEEVVLWFDDDDAGRKATEAGAKLFKVGKVRVAKAGNGYKDASDLLQANLPGDIEAAIYKAQAWRPKGIVNAKDSLPLLLAPSVRNVFYQYPAMMPKLQEMTGGMVPGDVIYHVAGTGVGKTACLREIQYGLIKQGVKIAVLSFEDTIKDAMLGLMSIEANERLHLVPLPDPDDAKAMADYDKLVTKYHEKVLAGGKVELFDAASAEWATEAILGYVRYCAKALDCQVVFIDPLSFVAAGIDLNTDERRVLDKCAMEFAKVAKETDVHVQISHHLKRVGNGVPHEEGAPTSLNELRSSGGLANFAMGVVGWERNQQASGDAWRVTRSRIIKPVRRTGCVGLADTLYYGDDGRLVPSPIPFPPIGKPEEDAMPSFGAVATTEY